MTTEPHDRRKTPEAMYDTAAALERSEAILHASAERSPDEETRRRLHSLGDQVTSQAKDIEARADAVAPAPVAPGPVASAPDALA